MDIVATCKLLYYRPHAHTKKFNQFQLEFHIVFMNTKGASKNSKISTLQKRRDTILIIIATLVAFAKVVTVIVRRRDKCWGWDEYLDILTACAESEECSRLENCVKPMVLRIVLLDIGGKLSNRLSRA